MLEASQVDPGIRDTMIGTTHGTIAASSVRYFFWFVILCRVGLSPPADYIQWSSRHHYTVRGTSYTCLLITVLIIVINMNISQYINISVFRPDIVMLLLSMISTYIYILPSIYICL